MSLGMVNEEMDRAILDILNDKHILKSALILGKEEVKILLKNIKKPPVS